MTKGKKKAINPESLTVEELEKLLAATGAHVTAQDIRAALAAGAPQENGRVNIVRLTQWLVKESMHGA